MAEEQVTKDYKNIKDITGLKSGRLTVRAIDKSSTGSFRYWICDCECGQSVSVRAYNLLSSRSTQSCGCLQREKAGETLTSVLTKHGMSESKECKSWYQAKQRCSNPNNPAYGYYGGRGIFMAEEWKDSFQLFFEHVGPCPDGYTLDRIDSNKGYEPGNVRWATRETQSKNRRCVIRITRGAETRTIMEWAAITGMSPSKIRYRHKHGLNLF